MRPVACLALLLLAACGDAESISWFFVSNPGGNWSTGSGGAVIVVRKTSSLLASTDPGSRRLTLTGVDEQGSLTVHLPTSADAAILETTGLVELRSAALNSAPGNGAVRIPGGVAQWAETGAIACTVSVPDAAAVDAGARGSGMLYVARGGNLIALEHADGLVVWNGGLQRYPRGTGLVLLGADRLQLQVQGGRFVPLTIAPLRAFWDRYQNDARRASLRIYGPRGEWLAEIPSASARFHGGEAGLGFSASLPQQLLLNQAWENAYLVRVETR
jgi:hypothetical protein